jgi:uncharacterized protein
MILESDIQGVIDQQRQRLNVLSSGLPREININSRSLSSHALIISGIRRCGKSTLMLQLMQQNPDKSTLYLNFESPLLYGFSLPDFARLDRIIGKTEAQTLLFDEIQMVEKWELYVRQKLDEGFKVIVTGSNASLLSRELGSKLTGRHISQELFPFSFNEFLKFKSLTPTYESICQYMVDGGFPEFLKSGDKLQLSTLFDDILIRDIVARYGIKDIKSLQRLASFLVSNIGNKVTASRLKRPLSIGATSTVLTWFSHLELSYLFSFLPVYSYSVKAQIINPRKVYSVDLGMVDSISLKSTDDHGRKLENLIFLHLRRLNRELYYFDNKSSECDFVVMKNGKPKQLIQVCYELSSDNLDREIKGLTESMRFFNLKKSMIVTLKNSDKIKKDGNTIDVLPAHELLTKS